MKQTEIGLIPDDWKEHTLRDLIDILTDYTANGSFESLARNVQYLEYPSYARLIRLTDIRTNFTNEGVYVSKYSYDFLKKSSLHGGELLLANVGAYAGFSFIYPETLMFRGTLGPNMFLIKFFNQKIDNTFAYYAFSYGTVYDQLISKAASSAQPKLNKEDVRTCYINIPSSIQEQQRIAKALSDVDAVISTTEKLIQKKKNIKQGTMQELLTGKKRLPGFAKSNNTKMTELGEIPEDWEVKTLNELINDISDGPFGSNLKTEHYTTEREVRIIQLSNVGEDGWDNENVKYTTFTHAKEIQRCIVPYGSIVIAKMMPAGRAILCPNKEKMYILGSDCVRISPNNLLDSLFFMYFSKTSFYLNQIKENTQGSTRARTSVSKLKRIEIALPPKKEQISIAKILSDMDNEIDLLNTKLEKYRNLKTAMMQQLLTGKIRL